jgi:hypothetical protein
MAVRPGEGDSIEQLVSLLVEELVRRGHSVTLFATGASETSAELRSVYQHGYDESGGNLGLATGRNHARRAGVRAG